MFTVIIQSKRSSDLMRDYRFLFKPFVDEGTIAFCDWNESGTDVRSSIPDIYSIIKGKNEWRAIILNTDSVYNYEGTFRPSKNNPFDYYLSDSEDIPHESPVPIIRLTHILGGYSGAVRKEFDKGYEYTDTESGEKIRVKAADLSEEEINQLSIDYCESLTSVYIEKEVDSQVVEMQKQMEERYSFIDVRPSEIVLISTEKKVVNDEKTKIVESWKNHLEMTSSSFWERNKYPNNCRFLFYEITNTDNSFYRKELGKFWLSVLTFSINKVSASTLQAYRLYKLHVDISDEELSNALNDHLNRLTSVYTFIKERMKLSPNYSFDEEEEIVQRQDVSVIIENTEGKNLYINFSDVGLCRDCPDDELSFWRSQVKQKKDNLEAFLKLPRRAINKAAKSLKTKTDSFVGENYALDRFQISDVKEYMTDLESRITSTCVENVIDKKGIDESITKIDNNVKKEISFRLRKKTAIVGGLVVLLIIFAGYIPYLANAANESGKMFFAALGLTLAVLLLSACGGLISLIFQRKHIVSCMKELNSLMRRISNSAQSYAAKFGEYYSDICTYMKAQSIIDGVDLKKENAISQNNLLNMHKRALQSAIDRDMEWASSYGITRQDELIPAVTSFFKTDVAPKENSLYYFPKNEDEDDIPVNSTGDLVTSPYKFVSKIWIEREDIYDEEEAK